jgi:hypothetical protein
MRWCTILLFAALVLLLPAPAWAWGPAAHLEFSLAVLRDLVLIAPAVAALLKRFPDDFIYGSIAADITQAKNLTPYHQHCHNWQVGFAVLDRAEQDDIRAFAWGYLSHLAADVVSHNYFVPYKMVQDYRRRGVPHVYWETRFETLVNPEAWELARRLSTRAYRQHDRHLRAILEGTLLPFRVNKQIFSGLVLLNRFMGWQRLAEAQARRTPISLDPAEMQDLRGLCMERVFDLLAHGPEAQCLLSDPTGHRNLILARSMRKRLRALHHDGRLLRPDSIGEQFKLLFRNAITATIDLPSLRELIDPTAPVQPLRRRRRLLKRIRGGLQRLRRRLRNGPE